MKGLTTKILYISVAIIMMLAVMPSSVRADDETVNAIILETNGSKIVYLEGLEDKDFKYAFTDSKDETNPNYQSSDLDSNNKNVVLIPADNKSKYIMVLDQTKTSYVELSKLKTITADEIDKINTLTKRIEVTTDGQKSASSTKEDGTVVTTTQGKIDIKGEDGFDYNYELIEIEDKNNTIKTPNEKAVELYSEFSNLRNAQTKYDELVAASIIKDDFNNLIDNAKWKKVENNEIMQPADSQIGEKYVVLIQKLQDGKVVINDVQFMTCGRKDDADVKYTNEVVNRTVEKKTALPVTGEAIALYIALGVIILAIIIVAIRMKQIKGKDDEKKN